MTIPDAQHWLKAYVGDVFKRIYRDLGHHPIKRELFETEEAILLAAIDEGADRLTRFLQGEMHVPTKQADAKQCDDLAVELEAQVQTDTPRFAGAGPVGAPFLDHVKALIAALKSHDATQIMRAVRDTLNHLLGEEHLAVMAGPPRAAGPVGAVNWAKWLEIITKVLSVIGPLLG